jgi:hypothetical protein
LRLGFRAPATAGMVWWDQQSMTSGRDFHYSCMRCRIVTSSFHTALEIDDLIWSCGA